MELLILVQAPLIVALFATLHRFAPPSGRSLTLTGLGMAVAMAAMTMGVHVTVLTVGRLPAAHIPGFDRLLTWHWPSVPYAIDILAWDYFFGLALLLAMAAFPAGRVQRRIRIRIGMAASAVLCLAGGLLGVLSGNMQIRDIGIIGYGVVFPSPSSTWLGCSLDRRQVPASRRMLPDQR